MSWQRDTVVGTRNNSYLGVSNLAVAPFCWYRELSLLRRPDRARGN